MIARILMVCMAVSLNFSVAHAQEQPRMGMQESSVQDPRNRSKLHTELGALYFQDRNIPVAMEELTIAIHIDSTYAPAYGVRALVHHYLNEPEHAQTNFQDALRYAPDDPEIANNFGWFLCQTGKYKEGLEQLERALRNRLYQTPDRAYMNAAQCAIGMSDMKLAESYLDKAQRFGGGNPAINYRRADLFYRTNRFEAARSEVSDLMRQMDPNAEVLWLAIRIERKLGNREVESRLSNQLRRRFPSSNENQELIKGNYE